MHVLGFCVLLILSHDLAYLYVGCFCMNGPRYPRIDPRQLLTQEVSVKDAATGNK